MYLPYKQADSLLPIFQLSVVLRTATAPLGGASALRAAVEEIDVNQPVVNVRTMEDNMASTVAEPRFRTWLLGIFAALALVLSAVGVYGVMSYSVNQRTNEIGIRIALGAQAPDVFRIIVGRGARLALAGVALGLAAALALGQSCSASCTESLPPIRSRSEPSRSCWRPWDLWRRTCRLVEPRAWIR